MAMRALSFAIPPPLPARPAGRPRAPPRRAPGSRPISPIFYQDRQQHAERQPQHRPAGGIQPRPDAGRLIRHAGLIEPDDLHLRRGRCQRARRAVQALDQRLGQRVGRSGRQRRVAVAHRQLDGVVAGIMTSCHPRRQLAGRPRQAGPRHRLLGDRGAGGDLAVRLEPVLGVQVGPVRIG
jgi:hypothetical protein